MANLSAIIGLFGAGKTATAVDFMLSHISKGGVVASNINLRPEPFISHKFGPQCGFRYALQKLYGWEYKEGQFIYLDDNERIQIEDSKGKFRWIYKPAKFWEFVPRGKQELPVLVVIDEAHKVFPKDAYAYMPSGHTDIISVLRHLNIELYIMSQAWEHVWVDLRRLCQDYYRINNLKDGGFGIISQLPFFIKPVVELFSLLLGLLIRPFLRFIPDFIRIRKFRHEEESRKYLYKGYPKIKRYSLEVLGSYDSPDSVAQVPTADAVPNDFRNSEQIKGQGGVKKKVAMAPAFLGVMILVVSACALRRTFVHSSGDSPVSAPAAHSSPVSSPSVSSNSLACSDIVYSWRSSVTGHPDFVGLPDGRRLCPGRVYDGRFIVSIELDRVVFSDGRFSYLVRSASDISPDSKATGSLFSFVKSAL